MRTKFLSKNVNERDHSEDLAMYGDNIKMDRKEIGCIWTVLNWFRIGPVMGF
jgi:hypothetical protein